jgi:hypothetical protein
LDITVVFVLEACLKIVALGFLLNGRTSYLRSGWNILDFCIVSISLMSLFSSNDDYSSLKALRTLRVLKPLRLISRNESLKIVINALIRSLTNVANVFLI